MPPTGHLSTTFLAGLRPHTVASLCPSKPQVSNMSLYRIKDRFAYMKAQGVVEVDVWEAPIPEDWFDYF